MVNMSQVAAAAYGATQKLPTQPGNVVDQKASFSDFLEEGLDRFVASQQKAEQLSADAAVGKADINDVILAVQDADVVLNTVVAVRDKIVQAYQDVLRMAI